MSADNFSKQFRPGSGWTKGRALSVSNLFDTQMVFPKEFFEKSRFFEKNQQTIKEHEKFLRGGGTLMWCLTDCLVVRLAPVLKTIFHQCVISYTCSQSNSDGSVLKQSHQS